MLSYYVNQALWLSFLVAAPVVIVTMVIGFVLGFIQAIFQLQDQALPFGIKLLCVTLVLVLLGPWMAGTLMQFTEAILNLIALPG
ncbi:type III secretion system export apparatus subunit SctS [Limnobacter sp. P1]|uniref:type III secretion system export apparatus subunit SctS n=1 Tax=Limnobacter olei TaxID=3031298 RepID=UPI0023AF406D|nr:type III secretion system export apparatus subunit SctS [Limnobacter sp. P1]